jgi:hypothetical protein
MSPDEIKSIVHGVLAEQRESHVANLDEAMVKTVAAILTSFGIDDEDRKEVRADFQHLRRWRKSVEQAQSYTFKAVITVIVTGFVGAVWLGIKATLGKQSFLPPQYELAARASPGTVSRIVMAFRHQAKSRQCTAFVRLTVKKTRSRTHSRNFID